MKKLTVLCTALAASAAADQPPWLELFYKESDSNEVYASAIGLCKNSMIMQSRKPSNSDFWRSFSM